MNQVTLASCLILLSGFTHAIVNAIVKSGKDKMTSRALLDGFSAILVLPAVFFVALPNGAWHWLLMSWAVHIVYLLSTIKGFEKLDLTVAYPVARGVAPMLASAGAVWMFGESLTFFIALGIALVSSGVIVLCLGKHVTLKEIAWPVLTGMTIAAYTLIDAKGVRAAPSAESYIIWIFLMLGGGIAVFFALWRGRAFLSGASKEWRAGLTAGALSIVTYGLALYSFRIGSMAKLAALRETSIMFATLIAVFFLKEKMTLLRLIAISLIGTGAMLLLSLG